MGWPVQGKGELFIGLDSSVTGRLVERSTHFTVRLHLLPIQPQSFVSREERSCAGTYQMESI